MPNKHAAIKALRQNKRRSLKNNRMKTHVKALTQQLKVLIKEGKKEEALAIGPKLQQAIAKAVKTNIFHGNKAGRKISAVHKALATLKK